MNTTTHSSTASHTADASTETSEHEFITLVLSYYRRAGAAAAHALLADIQRIADRPGTECCA
ncbi:MAG: hypothetical protein AB9M60_00360 [Leptothrix sp. (in: b-proteobacteria)]